METNFRFLIVEDDYIIAEMISEILSKTGYKNICMADSVEAAIKEIESNKPHLVLTDIALGKDKTGIDLAHLLNRKYKIPFIYITSHASPEILNMAKHTRPNAYIVKPFKNEDLIVAIEFALFNSNLQVENGRDNEDIMVKEGRAMVKLSCNDILWLEAEGNYTNIILNNGKRQVIRTSISEFETQLNAQRFMRIHKSYIVNSSCVTKVRANNLYLKDHEFPIGRTYQSAVALYFKN